MDPAAAAIYRLPEECVAYAISMTSPGDACHSSAVSPAFRAAANSDAVWDRFLPPDLAAILARADEPLDCSSKKDLFSRLCNRPVLLDGATMSFWLERRSGAKCLMLSARALQIVWSSTPRYWRWIPLADSRFSECAELLAVFCGLEIHGKIHSKMLSQNKTYAAHMVFKMADQFYGLAYPFQEASVSVGGSRSIRQVCLQGYHTRVVVTDVVLPQERADGWLELEMGEFYCEEGEDGEVCINLMGIEGGHWKKGLIVQGIEIKPKKSGLS